MCLKKSLFGALLLLLMTGADEYVILSAEDSPSIPCDRDHFSASHMNEKSFGLDIAPVPNRIENLNLTVWRDTREEEDICVKGCSFSLSNAESNFTFTGPSFWITYASRFFSFVCISIIPTLFVCHSFFPRNKDCPKAKKSSEQKFPSGEVIPKKLEPKEAKAELWLDVDTPISNGKHKKVYRGTYCQKSVAVKASYKAGFSYESVSEPEEAKHLRLLRKHRNVVALVISGAYGPETPLESAGKPYEALIVLEHCDLGTLHEALRNKLFSNSSRFETVRLCALDVAQGMAQAHAKRIIHGALHCKHIFLDSDSVDPRGFVCKVGGFGSSVRLPRGSNAIKLKRIPNISIAAPEAWKSGAMSYSSDVYAFGMLLYILCTNQSPFHGFRSSEIQQLVMTGKRPMIPEGIPIQLSHLIRECWSPYEQERPTFPMIVHRLEVAISGFCSDQLGEARKSFSHSCFRESAGNNNPSTAGKRYARINFQPAVAASRKNSADLDGQLSQVRRQSNSRRTKSCIVSFGISFRGNGHEDIVRQVDDMIKRSRESSSRKELRQFLDLKAH